MAGERDAEQILAIYAPLVKTSPVTFEYDVPSVDEIGRRLSETIVGHPWLICEDEGRVRGYAYAGKHRARAAYQWSVETSVYIAADSQRRGIGRGLYESLLRLVTLQGYHNAYGGITLPNPASVRLHEACGFEPLGVFRTIGYKFGAWHDVGWWQLRLSPRRAAPQKPLSIAEASRAADWESCLVAGVSHFR